MALPAHCQDVLKIGAMALLAGRWGTNWRGGSTSGFTYGSSERIQPQPWGLSLQAHSRYRGVGLIALSDVGARRSTGGFNRGCGAACRAARRRGGRMTNGETFRMIKQVHSG